MRRKVKMVPNTASAYEDSRTLTFSRLARTGHRTCRMWKRDFHAHLPYLVWRRFQNIVHVYSHHFFPLCPLPLFIYKSLQKDA